MIYTTQLDIETYFKDNWTEDIHYDNTEKHPNSDSWIFLEVEPIDTDIGISGCLLESSLLYITAYAKNKVESAKLADRVITFLRGIELAGSTLNSWRPVGQGEVYSGLHFRKLSFDHEKYN